jgi:hypothetical protein
LFCDSDDALEADAASSSFEIMKNSSYDIVIFRTKIIETGRNLSSTQKYIGEEIPPPHPPPPHTQPVWT